MNKQALHRFLTGYIIVVVILVIAVITKIIQQEITTSKYQARCLSEIAKQLSFNLNPGPSKSIRYPNYGPYDQRLGYTLIPDSIGRLEKTGFNITAQASSSPMMDKLASYGLFPIYQEKTRAGLSIVDHADKVIFSAVYPSRGYPNFQAIPPLILQTLLFIENKELLDDRNPTLNPAIEWDRFGFATLQMMAHKLGIADSVPGGSTLATQIEKYRHSSNGYTNSISDKVRQMASASIRAYMLGPDTREMRQQIVLAYFNSMPLSATPKSGEVHGLGDGLAAWFGADFNEVNMLLSPKAFKSHEQISPQQATAFRQVLTTLLSQRRPSYLLGKGYATLQELTDSYLRLMVKQGFITTSLRDAALKVTNVKPVTSVLNQAKFMAEKKTQSILRTRLAKTLGIKSNYELDRLDLTVKTTLDYNLQQAISKALHGLSNPELAHAAGIFGHRMLDGNIDLAPIIYSLMLFEKNPIGNLLRVQTDSFDQPLDINEGIRLDLGSTAKMRTMVHYLELITEIYQHYQGRAPEELRQIALHPRDYLSAWVIEQLKTKGDIGLEDLLNEALDRKYSASPYEYFYTGGGLHHFNNFDKSENSKIMSVRHALRDSTNLVFIRLMRDVAYHHLYKPDGIARWLDDPADPRRKEYLERFADHEGRVYLRRFYVKYQGKSPEEAMQLLTEKVQPKVSRFSMLYRSIYPNNDENQFYLFLKSHVKGTDLVNEDIYGLYDKYSIDNFDLQDQGYITKVHPLELWLVRYLTTHPNAPLENILAASYEQRLEVYRWLLKSKRKNSQQRRIMTLLEEEAFKEIHKAWQRVGYPFSKLTSSYATSIGASGDRPAALAELMGVLQNDGVRLPATRFDSLQFASATPYETILNKLPEQGQRIFPAEVAQVARGALAGVVEGGTASRLRSVYTDSNGKPLIVGGKTGTGDHRKQVWGERGRLLESKFISRAATFAFFLGDRFFGVITAYVEGPNAGRYHFTSSLPVQIIKYLKPTLSPLLNRVAEEKSFQKTSGERLANATKHND
ncbi:transglycosylase domain-containing protein [Methyloglobulus sp.]|uniref:transglycosylase domain-containing protein n=1 Tax=Methyloglobulus sp. TaxID=2518622 RepID=UPI003989E4A7